MKGRKMLSLRQLTPPYRYLLFIVATTVAFPLHTTSAHQPARLNFLFVQSVKKCLQHGANPNIFTPTRNLSRFSQTPPRDCKSVFRHFLVNFRSYVSTMSPLHSNSVPSDRHAIYNPSYLVHIFSDFGLNHDDLSQFRMTKMWAIVNEILKSGVRENNTICSKDVKPVARFNNQKDVHSDNGIWDTLFKRSLLVLPKAPHTSTHVEKIRRRRRGVERNDAASTGLGDVAMDRSAKRESRSAVPSQKRAYGGGSWYDLIRNRRQQVLSVNNAMATLSDMLMEHHRNRILRNRETLRYYMMLAG